MFSRDPYKKLHRRRRRRDHRPLFAALFALMLAGAGVYTTLRGMENSDVSLSATTTRNPSTPTVAMLTAKDAVTAARLLAVPIEEVPLVEEEPSEPTHWERGQEVSISGELQRNQSLSVALSKRGVTQTAIANLVAAVKGDFDFRKCRPGDAWEVDVAENGRITRFRYQSSPTDIVEATEVNGKLVVRGVDVPTERRKTPVGGKIKSSLWQSFEKTGAGGQLAAQYVDVFAYTIDFATETQPGDAFGAVYESTWLNEQKLGSGKLLAAAYEGAAGTHYAFRWKDAYYTADGESVERQFLRSPLATVRVTSNYGRRFHPVLKKMKMHAGVDYGAPVGTPVQSVASGRVVYAGWKGANGKLVAIQHANGYTTYYAHLSQIGADIRPGVRVKKKQVIGKVGNTGRSTGPHLHFGMKRHGKYINPLEVDFERGVPLKGQEREQFMREVVAPMKAAMAAKL